MSVHRWAAGLMLAAGSTILMLAGAEFAARLYLHHLEGRPGTMVRPLAVFDRELGWLKPPGQAAVIQRAEYRIHEAINAHGLRGPDRPYDKPKDVRRVLLLGDSFTEAANVEEDQTLRAVLEASLDARGQGTYEVINGGTAGYSTDQEYLFYRREGARYHPDFVVLVFYYNDLSALRGPEGNKPYFDVGDQGLVLRNSPVPQPEAQWNRDRRNRFVFRPWRGSYALTLLSNRTAAGNPELHRLLSRVGLVEPFDDAPPAELWPYGLGHRPEVADMWRRFAAILTALHGDAEVAGQHLLLFYVPAAFEYDDRAWDLTRRRYRLGRRWDRDRVASDLAAAVEEIGVPLVDPRPEMRTAMASGRRPCFPADGHWNVVGNALAAQVLERAIH